MAQEALQNVEGEIKAVTLEKIQKLLSLLNVQKIYFIDDAINKDTGKETFKGLIQAILASGKIGELQEIQIQGIDFTNQEAILIDHIDQVWDTLRHAKQLRYFEKAYTIAGQPDAIRDLNVSNNLKDFFGNNQIEFLTPNDWDDARDAILAAIVPGTRIIVLYDQDLKLANGRYADQGVQGEQLILELKQQNVSEKIISALLTHTITSYTEELPERTRICGRIAALTIADFFVLAKVRLEKPELFADGLKKMCLNAYCENIKTQTIEILKNAQASTISKVEKFDTYDFDHTVFKSSFVEGVWEPETLLRIIDVMFKDEVRELMIVKGYLTSTNPAICSASEISKIEFKIEDPVTPYIERFTLRNQEIFESERLINRLRKPIDNGDVFAIIDGEKRGKEYILVAQECDLVVRGETGNRGARTAVFLEIEKLTEKQLNSEVKRKHESDIKNDRYENHFFADKYKLEYFEPGTNKIGLVHFTKAIVIDLNVLDLIVFNELGEAILDLSNPTYDEKNHNSAWKKRYELINKEFSAQRDAIEKHYTAIAGIENAGLRIEMQKKFNHLFSFINKAGIEVNYNTNKFTFGIKRVARLRYPISKNLLDRYYQHLTRFAEPHDFAK